MLLQGSGRVRDRLIAYIEHKLELNKDQMKSEKETRIKGITEPQNIPMG